MVDGQPYFRLVLISVVFLCLEALESEEHWENSRQFLGQGQRRFHFWVKFLFIDPMSFHVFFSVLGIEPRALRVHARQLCH